MALDYGDIRAGEPTIPPALRYLFIAIWLALKKIKALDWITAGSGITVTDNGDGTVTIAQGAGAVTGAGSANRVTFWTGASTIDDSANLTFNDQSGAGTDAILALLNSQNNAGADTIFRLYGAGSSAGDQQIIFSADGSTGFRSIGLDNSDADKIKFEGSATLGGGSSLMTMDFANLRIGVHTESPSYDLDMARNVNAAVTLAIRNIATVSSSAAAILQLETTTTGSDPQLLFVIGSQNWVLAVDNSDSDALVISESNSPGTNNRLRVASGGQIRIRGGQSTSMAGLGGTLDVNTTAVGNVGVGEDDLMSYSVPASTLGADGDSLRMVAGGTFAATNNNKRLRVKFGASTIFDSGALAITAATDWALEVDIIRTGATAQKCISRLNTSSGTLSAYCDYATAAETMSGAVTLKLTGEATADNDIVAEMMRTNWESAP